ncbi:MAG: T9SS type A sorting domain-containing protein, partial [Bacteroidota bacterium]
QLQDNGTVALAWRSATEENVSHFEIEKRGDINEWRNIGRLEAVGWSVTTQQYAYVDAQPLSGNNYYRLKMVDQDESYEYSPIRAVEPSAADKTSIQIFPNPTADQLNLRLPHTTTADGDVSLQIFDQQGRLQLQAQRTVESGILSLSLQRLAPGSYVIRLRRLGHTSVHRFVKL